MIIRPKVKCYCSDVDFGSYENTTNMKVTRTSKWICIDICIATVIAFLWHEGIVTLNSCCGHNKLPPTVIVTNKSIEKMKKLGYKPTHLKCAMPKNTFNL